MNPTLTKAFNAEAAVDQHRIVKFGTDDTAVVQAAAAADLSFGISATLPSDAGETCDVVVAGIAELKFGGTVNRGDLVTADAEGKGVTAANGRFIGVALASAVDGDIAPVLISPSKA